MLPAKKLHKVFEARVREAPRRIALCAPAEQLTYGELNLLADRVARHLRSLGIGPGALVGLCLERKAGLIAGMLGILKAGAAYVPIDPAYPAKRIQFLAADSGIGLVVTETALVDRVTGLNTRLLCLDDLPALSTDTVASLSTLREEEDSAAYVIYTSGSTGAPKGVLVEHRNVIRLFEQTAPWFQFSHEDVWTMFHSISFDFSVWEIWGALLYGGCLVIVPSDVSRFPSQFLDLLREKKVTVLNQTPSAFRPLVAEDHGRAGFSLRLMIFGGEALDLRLLEPWIARYGDQNPQLFNMYGITETTVHVTLKRLLREDLGRSDISPIGVPIPDLQLHLLDEERNPVPDGSPGELYVSGPGLARGYLRRPELTAERFLEGAVRLYRTGDRAVRLVNGEFAYLGRVDDQLKVRGFRIEPREVEFCLCGHSDVARAVVMPQDYGDGDIRLVAYVVPRAGLEPDSRSARLIEDLAARAAAELPLHMRPSAFFVIPEVPLNANGKVDREALRQLAGSEANALPDAAPQATSTQRTVIGIWEEILQRKGVGLRDDFFDLGGTSLALIRIFARVNAHFKVALNGSVLAEDPTPAQLAVCIDAELKGRPVQEAVLEKK